MSCAGRWLPETYRSRSIASSSGTNSSRTGSIIERSGAPVARGRSSQIEDGERAVGAAARSGRQSFTAGAAHRPPSCRARRLLLAPLRGRETSVQVTDEERATRTVPPDVQRPLAFLVAMDRQQLLGRHERDPAVAATLGGHLHLPPCQKQSSAHGRLPGDVRNRVVRSVSVAVMIAVVAVEVVELVVRPHRSARAAVDRTPRSGARELSRRNIARSPASVARQIRCSGSAIEAEIATPNDT